MIETYAKLMLTSLRSLAVRDKGGGRIGLKNKWSKVGCAVRIEAAAFCAVRTAHPTQ